MIIEFNTEKDEPDDSDDDSSNAEGSESDDTDGAETDEKNKEGTLIIDVTCAPQNINYPQDINLLNEARENLEGMIDQICYEYGLEKRGSTGKCEKRLSEPCKMQKTDKEEDQEGNQTTASVRKKGNSRKIIGKTSCDRESVERISSSIQGKTEFGKFIE